MNSVVLSGRLTKNIEVKTSGNGTAYCNFSIAVDKFGKDKQKKTMFVDCVTFGHSANFLNAYCHKGSFVTICGELDCTIKEYDDGGKRTFWSVIANQVEAYKPTDSGNQSNKPDDSLPFEM